MKHRCSCSHEKSLHEHWRAGTDCAVCECPQFHVDRSEVAAGILYAVRQRVSRLLGLTGQPGRRTT